MSGAARPDEKPDEKDTAKERMMELLKQPPTTKLPAAWFTDAEYGGPRVSTRTRTRP